MISYQELYELYDYFGYVFEYGFSHKYSFDYMQNRIANSKAIKDIENKSDCSFLINSSLKDVIKDIYELKNNDFAVEIHPNTVSFWVAEAYLRLSFRFHKSLSFIFLYIPIEEMIRMFSPYHEMDWSHLYHDFEQTVLDSSLLRKILDYKHLSINKLSQLTGISKNTLTSYLNDQRLMEAKFDYIYKISQVLDIDIAVFANKVNNYEKDELEKPFTNKELFSTLAMYFLSYYSSEIANRNYVYDKQNELYVDKDSRLKVFMTSNESVGGVYNQQAEQILSKYASSMSNKDRSNTIVVIYELKDISDSVNPYKKWIEYGFDKIFIINSKAVICIKESYWLSHLEKDIREKILTRLI